jgi:hypothetical protein
MFEFFPLSFRKRAIEMPPQHHPPAVTKSANLGKDILATRMTFGELHRGGVTFGYRGVSKRMGREDTEILRFVE